MPNTPTPFSHLPAPDPRTASTENETPGALGAAAFSPLYQQIKTLILRGLQAGEWKPGDAIPSEFELAARYRVSQGTVRKAIDELATDNLLVRRQGKGTFVATHAAAKARNDAIDLGNATRYLARQLGGRTGDPVLQVKRVLSFAGAPAILEDIWLPGGPFKGLTLEALSDDTGPMYALFETQFGVRMVRAVEKIKAVSADAETARLLAVGVGHPLLSVERVACTYNDVPMELRRGLYRTDGWHYRNDLS